MLYTVLSNIAFILFESNAYPGPLTEAAACAEPEFKEYFNVEGKKEQNFSFRI